MGLCAVAGQFALQSGSQREDHLSGIGLAHCITSDVNRTGPGMISDVDHDVSREPNFDLL